jgi:hypothetical protein
MALAAICALLVFGLERFQLFFEGLDLFLQLLDLDLVLVVRGAGRGASDRPEGRGADQEGHPQEQQRAFHGPPRNVRGEGRTSCSISVNAKPCYGADKKSRLRLSTQGMPGRKRHTVFRAGAYQPVEKGSDPLAGSRFLRKGSPPKGQTPFPRAVTARA